MTLTARFQGRVSAITIKRSRFLAYCRPVESEAAAWAFVNETKSAQPQAKHCVYAWKTGGYASHPEGRRFSDAAEPQGTAGMPVLLQIEALELTDVSVAVVRYFGGILLGTGGLTRSYGEVAAQALIAAPLCLMRRSGFFTLRLDYSHYQSLRKLCEQMGWPLVDETFTQEVHCRLAVPVWDETLFRHNLADLSAGRAEIQSVRECYWPTPPFDAARKSNL